MTYNSFGDYLKSLPPNTIFRLWEYKRMFTPYEQAEQFIDQSIYKNEVCDYIIIKDVINLPDGDLLLAVSDECDSGIIDYYRLSDITLSKVDSDMEEE